MDRSKKAWEKFSHTVKRGKKYDGKGQSAHPPDRLPGFDEVRGIIYPPGTSLDNPRGISPGPPNTI